MKSTIISNYNMVMRVAIFGVSEICLTFNHFIYIIVGSKNFLSMKNRANAIFMKNMKRNLHMVYLGILSNY